MGESAEVLRGDRRAAGRTRQGAARGRGGRWEGSGGSGWRGSSCRRSLLGHVLAGDHSAACSVSLGAAMAFGKGMTEEDARISRASSLSGKRTMERVSATAAGIESDEG